MEFERRGGLLDMEGLRKDAGQLHYGKCRIKGFHSIRGIHFNHLFSLMSPPDLKQKRRRILEYLYETEIE